MAHVSTQDILSKLAILYHNQQRFEEAAAKYEASIEGLESLYPLDHPQVLNALMGLAESLVLLGQEEAATRPLDTILERASEDTPLRKQAQGMLDRIRR